MDQWTEKLDIYLDGELPASEMQALQEHVRGCPSCAADILSRVQMKRAVQSAANQYKPRAEFRQRVRAQIAPRPRFMPARIWAMAAVLLIAASLTLLFVRQREVARQQVFNEIADLHVSTLASANPVDVISTDRHTVKPWFQGKLPFTFELPEQQNSEFTLAGGRVAYVEQSPGAELIYQIRKHQISVFIFQQRAFVSAGDESLQRRATFNVESWSQNSLRYFVIGDANAQDIHRLAQLMRQAGQP